MAHAKGRVEYQILTEGANMELFGFDVPMKLNPCSLNGKKQDAEGEYVNLYVRITEKCNASCAFCEFRDNKSKNKFDLYKFYYVLNEVNKKVRVNKVTFTGGEPTMISDVLNDALGMVKEINQDIFTVINSNGFALGSVDFHNVDSYALSRHGIGSENNDAFNTTVMSDKMLNSLDISTKEKIHITCNLDKSRTATTEDMYRLINHYSKMGFHDFGFVTLMEVNEYCKANKIDFRSLDLDSMSNTIRSRAYNNENACFCANYLTYDDEGTVNRWYARHYCDRTRADSTLVYDLNKLKIGFNGDVILG